jgi:chromosome segregation ATPase
MADEDNISGDPASHTTDDDEREEVEGTLREALGSHQGTLRFLNGVLEKLSEKDDELGASQVEVASLKRKLEDTSTRLDHTTFQLNRAKEEIQEKNQFIAACITADNAKAKKQKTTGWWWFWN